MAGAGLYSVQLDQERAQALAREGGTLLLLGVPQGTVVGIDQQTHIVGPKFKGVKMLPPGTHMLAYNAVSRQGDFSATTSFFIRVAPRQVVVRRWDAQQEQLLPLADEDEVERLADGVRRFDFDEGLAPYNIAAFPVWQGLASYIDAAVMDRLAPAGCGAFSITAEAAPAGAPSEAEQKLAAQLAAARVSEPEAEPEAEPKAVAAEQSEPSTSGRQADASAGAGQAAAGACHYTHIPRTVKRPGMTAAELTSANLDKSQLLEEVIESACGGDANGLLGELQWAFLAFVVGHSLQGFGQWKALLHLLLSCQAAPLHKRPRFFAHLLAALQAQLELSLGQEGDPAQAAPLGVPLVDELLADSFLKRLFAGFFDCLATAEHPLDPALKAAQEALQATLLERLGWDFRFSELNAGESDDEFAPVVVDL